ADLVAATKSFREREIRYAFNAPLLRNCGRFDIGLPETRSGRDMVRSGRVLPTSVKSLINSALTELILKI
ncbi:MAG: hypothetical protein ACLS70_09230, partial [[Clostridium] symbiosum]